MKVIINKNNITDVLSKIQGITGHKSGLGVTENVLIRAIGSGISLMATDLETGFEGFYPASVEKEGAIAINAKKFYEICRDFPSGDMILNENENRWIEITNNNIEYHIVGIDPDDFPDMPITEDVEFNEINSGVLKKMIERTVSISGGSDEKRAHLLGILLEKIQNENENILRMVSTDGNRLSKFDNYFDLNTKILIDNNIIIPKKALNEVGKFLDGKNNVRIGLRDDKFIVKKDNETIIIRLLNGDFPEYKEIINNDNNGNILKIDRKEFLMTLKRMSILSTETYKAVLFHFSNAKLSITASNPDYGQSKEDMVVDFNGKPIEVAFNPKYFIDTLNFIESNIVVLNIKDHESACFLNADNDTAYLSAIMPMRI